MTYPEIIDLMGQVEGSYYLGAIVGENTFIATLAGFTEYKQGQIVIGQFVLTNTAAACTLNINGLGARNIMRGAATQLVPGEILANAIMMMVYTGNVFVLQSVATLVQNAAQWGTARTLTLTGGVTGNASIKGDANVSLATALSGCIKSTQNGLYSLAGISAATQTFDIPTSSVNFDKTIALAWCGGANISSPFGPGFVTQSFMYTATLMRVSLTPHTGYNAGATWSGMITWRLYEFY